MSAKVWTDQQFEQMSWHDNHVHALRIVEGVDGSGELELDLDYILEWISNADGGFRYRIVPVTLTFHEVMFLRASLDYATPTAAFGPFMIHEIERRFEQRERYVAQLWNISVNWPSGEFAFGASGYTQRGFGEPILSERQCLSLEQRTRGA